MFKMKKFLFTTAACLVAACAFAQQTIYTVAYNRSAEGKNFPVMIGGVNVADGNNQGLLIGLANSVHGWQRGTQMGIFNAVGGDVQGAQFGIVNAFGGNQRGALFGVFNGVRGQVSGAQFGIINAFADGSEGAQFGVVNLNMQFEGVQFGVINFNGGGMRGTQFGVINLVPTMTGVQFGVVNFVRQYRSGVPIGILSIVRDGGYQAVELSTSSMFPVNLSLKTGIKEFYTSIIMAYSPDFHKQVSMGFGIGTIADISRKFYFNPEFNCISTFEKESASIYELHPNFGYRLSDRFSILAAPTLSWQNIQRSSAFNEPLYSLWNHRIDSRNELYLGLRFALRYHFNW